jgi:hypothetical protein
MHSRWVRRAEADRHDQRVVEGSCRPTAIIKLLFTGLLSPAHFLEGEFMSGSVLHQQDMS